MSQLSAIMRGAMRVKEKRLRRLQHVTAAAMAQGCYDFIAARADASTAGRRRTKLGFDHVEDRHA